MCTGKETEDIWCVPEITSYEKQERAEQGSEKICRFLQCLITKLSSFGFLILFMVFSSLVRIQSTRLCETLPETILHARFAKRVFEKVAESLAQASTINSNHRREWHQQRIRKPELHAFVSSNVAKNLLRVLFGPSFFRFLGAQLRL